MAADTHVSVGVTKGVVGTVVKWRHTSSKSQYISAMESS